MNVPVKDRDMGLDARSQHLTAPIKELKCSLPPPPFVLVSSGTAARPGSAGDQQGEY